MPRMSRSLRAAIAIIHRGRRSERDIRGIFVYIEIRATSLPRGDLDLKKGDSMASKKSSSKKASKKSSKKASKKAPAKKAPSKKGGSKKAPSKKGGTKKAPAKKASYRKPAPPKKKPAPPKKKPAPPKKKVAYKKPPSKKGGSKKGGKSVISRAVETIRGTASSIGSSVSSYLPT